MSFTPATIVKLCNVPIDVTQKNQIRFTTRALQKTYFDSTVVASFTDFTYQRNGNGEAIRVPTHIDSLHTINYVMYDNSNFTSRWFYAFITKKEYINDSCTALYIETDVYQTWMLDCTMLSSFVSREHITTDTIGTNCVPEGLELGEYVYNSVTHWTELNDLATILAVSEDSAGDAVAGRIYNGVFSGLGYIPFFGTGYVDDLRDMIDTYVTAGKAAAIIAMFTFPSALLPDGTTSGEIMAADSIFSPYITKTVTINGTTIGSYTVKNKKLLTYPYNYLHVSNLQGQSVDYQLEKFDGGYPATVSFSARGCIIPGARVGCITQDYKYDDDYAEEQVLTLANYPLCNWTADAWKTWIAQNALGVFAMAAGSALSIGTGFATGQPLAIAGGVIGVMNELSTVYQKTIEPPSVQGNVNNSTLQIARTKQHFAFYQVQISPEFAAIIDGFFEMYGYKTNKLKVPNVSGRPYWNYVKTVDVNITGPIPNDDMTALKNIYNNGVTIWHSGANVGNYSLNNH